MRHLIDIKDLSVNEIDELIRVANDIIKNKEKYSHKCDGKKLATLFFEPSTRTRLSFEAAMLELGGSVLGFSESSSSSVSKGESVSDTIRIVGCYSDIIAMRHPKEGAPLVACKKSTVPIINAGDGGHNHPTQTLTDLLTISREKGRLNNLTIGLCGDLKFGRTVHSLVTAMSRYSGVKFVLISPDELTMPEYIKKNVLEKNKIEYCETKDIEEYLPKFDVLYMTRIQRERFSDPQEYERLKDCYILNRSKLENAKKDLVILHPLPRVNEISTDVDDDMRAKYFEQALCGKYIRMALILDLLGMLNIPENENSTESKLKSDNQAKYRDNDKTLNTNEAEPKYSLEEFELVGKKCKNPRCITTSERDLKQRFILVDGTYRCKYCETSLE